MSAAETAALPWNTTKTGVDEDSRVWRQVQAQIKVSGAQVVSILNRLKREEQQAENDTEMPTVTAMRSARLMSTKELPKSETFVVPEPPKPTRNRRPRRTIQKFQFEVPLDRYTIVAQNMQIAVVAEVGRRLFDYYYDREIES